MLVSGKSKWFKLKAPSWNSKSLKLPLITTLMSNKGKTSWLLSKGTETHWKMSVWMCNSMTKAHRVQKAPWITFQSMEECDFM